MENVEYRAAKLVTGAYHFTSRDKLYNELGWESLQQRNDYLGLNIFQKIHLHETRPLIRTCLQPFEQQFYNFRSKGAYRAFQKSGMKFKNSFFPYFTKLWNSLPPSEQGKNMFEFKEFTKK